MRSLARVHAVSRIAAAEEHADDAPRWEPRVTTADEWEARLAAARARFPQVLTSSLVDRPYGLSRMVELAVESLQRSGACWIHGDAHLDNVLFRPGGAAVLPRLVGRGHRTGGRGPRPAFHRGCERGRARSELATDLIAVHAKELDRSGAEALIGDPWEALSDGLAPLVQAAIAWAARDETREPQVRMQALQENLLRRVCAWVSSEHVTEPGRIFA